MLCKTGYPNIRGVSKTVFCNCAEREHASISVFLLHTTAHDCPILMDSVLLVKLISALVYPLGLFFVLLVLGWLLLGVGLRRSGRLAQILAWLIIILASNPLIAEKLVGQLERSYPQTALDGIQEYDVIIVLGGGLRIPLPPAAHTQIGSGSDRYWYAARLFKAQKASTILLVGGNVYPQPSYQGEAHYAAELLQEWGIPGAALKIETASRTTRENASNVRAWLQQQNIQRALLVTSAYHMPRAMQAFADVPIQLTAAPADILIRETQRPTWRNWIPSAAALSLTTLALHEYYGMAFMRFQTLRQGS